MTTNKDDDFDGPGQEFSLPHEIVPIDRSPRVVSHRPVVVETPVQAAGQDAEAAAGMDFSQIVHALRRNWLLGLVVGILAAGPLVVTAWYSLPVEYQAVEFVRIAQNHATLVFETADS
ncbi:MAG: hypothetical protein WCH39_24515, partial [Schlesneria sp.]